MKKQTNKQMNQNEKRKTKTALNNHTDDPVVLSFVSFCLTHGINGSVFLLFAPVKEPIRLGSAAHNKKHFHQHASNRASGQSVSDLWNDILG